jgi:hypothetical protein
VLYGASNDNNEFYIKRDICPVNHNFELVGSQENEESREAGRRE